ncbi:MAG: PDZ domain-containing protein, partial [Acidobacteriota bacterium]|nr:PDZ domain-containing protein [Acidobacteriota bacterium]
GSDGALGIYDYFAKAHDLRRRLPRVSSAQTGAGVGGETSNVDARVRGFRLGPFVINNPVVGISEDDNEEGARPKYDGMIGTEVFRRFRVVIDYAHGRLILSPNRFFGEPYETDMSGLDLVAEGEDFRSYRVERVAPNSPASDAGVRVGDLLSEIDGRAASSLTLDEITRMFERAGRDYQLTLRRGDQTLSVKIKTRRMI